MATFPFALRQPSYAASVTVAAGRSGKSQAEMARKILADQTLRKVHGMAQDLLRPRTCCGVG
jgi:hypothetical protein